MVLQIDEKTVKCRNMDVRLGSRDRLLQTVRIRNCILPFQREKDGQYECFERGGNGRRCLAAARPDQMSIPAPEEDDVRT